MGASNKYTADEQLEQIAFYWMNLGSGQMTPLTVRLLSRHRDVYLDLAGGNRIPKISERQAKSVEELRLAGVGVNHALLVHPDTAEGSDLFKAVITMLDPHVAMGLVPLPTGTPANGESWVEQDVKRAEQLRRELDVQALPDGDIAKGIVQVAERGGYDLVIIGQTSAYETPPFDVGYVVRHAPCWVCLVTPSAIPPEVEEK